MNHTKDFIRVTENLILILSLFFINPKEKIVGYAVLKTLGMKGGVVYPVLKRLEKKGYLSHVLIPSNSRGEDWMIRAYFLTTGGDQEVRKFLFSDRVSHFLLRKKLTLNLVIPTAP